VLTNGVALRYGMLPFQCVECGALVQYLIKAANKMPPKTTKYTFGGNKCMFLFFIFFAFFASPRETKKIFRAETQRAQSKKFILVYILRVLCVIVRNEKIHCAQRHEEHKGRNFIFYTFGGHKCMFLPKV
jgi:hypothetical protein